MQFDGCDVILEITRWCNMECYHCIRGEREKKRMSKDAMRTVFGKFNCGRIGTLTFTGGEPTLALDLMEYALECARMYHVNVGNIWMATNGTCTSQKFFKLFERWMNYCDDREMCGIRVSIDQYHERVFSQGAFRDFQYYVREELGYRSFYIEFNGAPNDYDYLYNAGRAQGWGGKEVENKLGFYEYDDDEWRLDGDLYIGANGILYPTCDISYELMRNEYWQICRVEDDWAEALERWRIRQTQMEYA